MNLTALITAGRRMISDTLVDRAVVHDRAVVRDTSGGTKSVWTARTQDTPALFGRLTDPEAEVLGAGVAGKAQGALSLPLNYPIEEGDRVRNPGDLHPTRMWTVTGIFTPQSNLALNTRVGIREV